MIGIAQSLQFIRLSQLTADANAINMATYIDSYNTGRTEWRCAPDSLGHSIFIAGIYVMQIASYVMQIASAVKTVRKHNYWNFKNLLF